VIGQLSYPGVLGGLTVRPLVIFSQDVNGVTPGPPSAFIEDRETLTLGVNFEYVTSLVVRLRYSSFGDGRNDTLERDFLTFDVTYSF